MNNYSFKAALFGHPAGHSLSPEMHAANFRSLGLANASYEAFDVPPEKLADALASAKASGLRGLNLTIPHKTAIIPLLDELDASAIRYKSVNTVLISADGHTLGYNTDVPGFLEDLKTHGVELRGRRVLVAGAGGVGRAIALGCADAGAAEVVVANRSPREGTIPLDSRECHEFAKAADVIVNATSLGLRPEDPPVLPANDFSPGQMLYDLIPVRRETPSRATARAAGAATAGGLGMLVLQGALAFRIWTGIDADTDAMRKAVGIA